MKNYKLAFLVLVLMLAGKLSKAGDLDTAGVFMTMENEIVYMYGDASITAQTVGYHDIKNKEKSFAMRKLKWMIFGNRVWCAFPIRKGDRTYRLQEIIVMTKKYILMSFWQGSPYLYVYDYNSDLVEGKIMIYEGGWGSKKRNQKAYDKIKPYFNNCNEVMKMFEENLDKEKMLIDGMYVEQCEGAPAVMDFLSTFKDKRMKGED